MMASGGNMSSFDEDATSVPESTLRVPDVKVKEEYVEIHVITEQETISARSTIIIDISQIGLFDQRSIYTNNVNPLSAETVFIHQNLAYVDVRFLRIKTILALKKIKYF